MKTWIKNIFISKINNFYFTKKSIILFQFGENWKNKIKLSSFEIKSQNEKNIILVKKNLTIIFVIFVWFF